MARIAFILLAHKDPSAVARQARTLAAAGDGVAIHYDRDAPAAEFALLRDAVAGAPGIVLAGRRRRCGWGDWSLVAATLDTLRTALDAFGDASHFYMVSGDCAPIRSAAQARATLTEADADFIESHDFFDSDWIRTGPKAERLVYRHPFNERRHKRLFDLALSVQQAAGLTRALPADLRIHIGSQWWCLRRATARAVLDTVDARPDLIRFFRTTWIPDETFFQSLVRHLVPAGQIRNRPPTFLLFTDYGMPATFHDDHAEFLLAQDALFARKIAGGAAGLRQRLTDLWTRPEAAAPPGTDGAALHRYLTGRGRVGRRFAPRFWEAEASLGRERTLLILACRKRPVARRLTARIRAAGLVAVEDYVFDDCDAPVPDLGGIGASLVKRHRHRRALCNLLFRHHGTDRLLICLDPARADLVADLAGAPARVRLLEVACRTDDAWLRDHARRRGLLGPGTPDDMRAHLLSALAGDLQREDEALHAAAGDSRRIGEAGEAAANAAALAGFLDVAPAVAQELLAGDDLFAD